MLLCCRLHVVAGVSCWLLCIMAYHFSSCAHDCRLNGTDMILLLPASTSRLSSEWYWGRILLLHAAYDTILSGMVGWLLRGIAQQIPGSMRVCELIVCLFITLCRYDCWLLHAGAYSSDWVVLIVECCLGIAVWGLRSSIISIGMIMYCTTSHRSSQKAQIIFGQISQISWQFCWPSRFVPI